MMGLWCMWSLCVNESGLLNVMLVVEGGHREIEGAAFIKIRIESRSAGIFR